MEGEQRQLIALLHPLNFRQYSQFIISTIQLIKCAALFLAPATVAFFVSDEADLAQVISNCRFINY